MATLHVRNVPDSLYEALRASAEQNGRSIGAQAIALLNESLSSGRRGFPFFGRGVAQPGADAAGVLEERPVGDRRRPGARPGARARARRRRAHPGGAAFGRALARGRGARGAAGSTGRGRSCAGGSSAGPGTPPGRIPFSDEAKKSLELALRESLHQRSPAIEREHVLVGLAGAGGRAAKLLASSGVTQARLRAAILGGGSSRCSPRSGWSSSRAQRRNGRRS